MLKYIFVTSCSKQGYEQYGRRMLLGYKNNMPHECILVCFVEGWTPDVEASNIWYFDLNKDTEHVAWKERHKNNLQAHGHGVANGAPVVDYRWQCVRFSNKVAALTSFDLPSSQWRIWLDMDIIFEKPIPITFFDALLGDDNTTVAHYIGRPPAVWHTSELGFAAYNTKTEDTKQFLHDFRHCYLSDQVFTLQETHDSFVFDRIREHYESQGCKFHDIAAGLQEFHPWPHTILGQYMTHLKGPTAKTAAEQLGSAKAIDIKVHNIETGKRNRKVTSFNAPKLTDGKTDTITFANGCKNRYEQLNNIIMFVKPKVVLEVGTFKGDRAIEMCKVMTNQGQNVHYIGFDVFEDGTPEFNKQEMNGKGNSVYQDVIAKLTQFQTLTEGKFTFELFRGKTCDTLAHMNLGATDFVFIDGGHSVETIAGDYEALKDAKVIVFDDFYLDGVDTKKFGCNEIVNKIPHTLLPMAEKQPPGIVVAMALTGTDILDKLSNKITHAEIQKNPKNDKGMRIKTRNCVPDDIIHRNIRYSATYAKEAKIKQKNLVSYAPPILKPTDDILLFIGGGDSVLDPNNTQYNKNWDAIRNHASFGTKILAVKTSYDVVIAKGIVPWGCLLLDPRDHVADKIQHPHKDTVYFIASMCDKSTWDKFAGGGYKCVGYHAGVLAGEDKIVAELYDKFIMVHGGTTAGFRGLSLMYTLGFRNYVFAGFDSSYENKPVKTHGRSEKPATQVHVHGKDFWTDPELVAQSQDMEMLSKHLPAVKIRYLGNGMLQHANDTLQTMLQQQFGAREKAVLQLLPYVQSLQNKQDLNEALTIESAMSFLQERKKLIDDTVALQGTLQQWLGKQ